MSDIEVVQKLNPAVLVQANLDAINQARTPTTAALHVARLYQNLGSVRSVDQDFDDEWDEVLDGNFMQYVGDDRLRRQLTWNTVWSAEGALTNLMARHGMTYRAEAEDRLEREEQELLQLLELGAAGQLIPAEYAKPDEAEPTSEPEERPMDVDLPADWDPWDLEGVQVIE